MAKIQGLNKFIKWSENAPKELTNEVKQIVTKTAYQIEATAKRLTPVDTGHLRRSITTDIQDNGDSIVAEVGTNVEYALHIEHGTSKQNPKPFLNPAYIQYKDKFEKAMKDAMNGVGE